MSQRALALPLRAALRPSQWTCRRCLATQADSALSAPPSNDALSRYTPSPARSSRPAQAGPPNFMNDKQALASKLAHRIPPQYLQHSTSKKLNCLEREERALLEPHQEIRGVVVSAGMMDKTVRVRVPGRRWNRRIGKYFASYTQHLVHDPNNSLVVGDVIQLHRLKVSSQVHHVVGAVTAPFGKPLSGRPPIPTPDERLAKYKKKRFAKLARRSLRRRAAMGSERAIKKLQTMGLDPGKGVEAGKGETANVQADVGKKRNPTNKDGGIVGKKGQKLPHGVLPGGKHEVGKIDERAKHNKESAMKMNEQAEANLHEARGKADALAEQGLSADTGLPRKSSVGDAREQ